MKNTLVNCFVVVLVSAIALFPQSCEDDRRLQEAVAEEFNKPDTVNALPDPELLSEFKKKMEKFKSEIKRRDYAILIDFEKPILDKRLWLINLRKDEVVFSSKVSHAFKSGVLYARDLSNVPNTEKSCAGCFITAETYYGAYGYSMKIRGLEKGVNDNAYDRLIVFHKRVGIWSYGCFMTDELINKELIDLTNGGAFVYVRKSE